MSQTTKTTWNPETYHRFRGLRLRPAVDLIGQIGALPDGPVVDLGCGSGAVAEALRARFDSTLIGVDASAEMLAEATGYDHLQKADIATWAPSEPPALIFSNAALHWLSSHQTLIPSLAAKVAEGGVLAVQMPAQHDAPSHKGARDLAEHLFPSKFDYAGYKSNVIAAAQYAELLAPFGKVNLWQTEYFQPLAPAENAHPVRRFTESTMLLPILERLDDLERELFLAQYDARLLEDYPLQADGGVMFPFLRLFFVLTKE